ncbi:MAG: hypothetical protein C4576_01490 [Desulfobacteraceae bacterium]|nr:MAG: hypothetical protein C4576_01490 [Desulfobacteraceae bacterium]
MADEETYFHCPNCQTHYNFEDFHKLEHMSRTSPGENPEVLGHARCRNCTKDFYYHLRGDGYPVTVGPAVPPDAYLAPPWVGTTDEEQEIGLPVPAPAVEERNLQDKMALFEQALKDIDENLQTAELYKRVSEALDTILTEPPPMIEAAFDMLTKKFGFNARKIEAFRKDVNRKRDHIETEKVLMEIRQVFDRLTKAPKELEEEERQHAIDYLRDPDLFRNISRDIALAGEVIGEETNKMMLYLAATSRKFRKPISLVIFGKSSSGKSYLANAIEKFMPEEDNLVLSSMSPKALEYMGDQLKHRLILVQEWEGLTEALPTLRTLQSEGKLARLVTAIDPVTKTRVARAHTQDCPCSVIVTTTKEGIHDENSTRIFELYADESVEQTKRVVMANLAKADIAKRMSPEEKEGILALHHNVQRVLQPVEVNIPYAEHLSFPAKTTRHRRDSERFINLIKAVAFLRQYQKEDFQILGDGRRLINADQEDYRIAYEIGLDVIRATLNTISNRSKNALHVCCELNDRYMAAKKDPLFSVTEIQETAQELGLDFRNRQDLYKQLDKLEEYEYLERKQARKNSIRYYKVCFAYQRNGKGEIVNIDTPDIKEILTPDQLRDRLRKGNGSGVAVLRQTEDLREGGWAGTVPPARG